jgi:hypothetical protein
MHLKLLWLAAILSGMATAQTLVQPNTLDVAATGVYLAALDDIGYTATVEALIAQDVKCCLRCYPTQSSQ